MFNTGILALSGAPMTRLILVMSMLNVRHPARMFR
jgi:hypothetical protein